MTVAASPVRTISSKKVRRAGLVGVVLATALLLTSCMSTRQDTALALVNETRSSAGLSTLQIDPTATVKAQAWAEHLAAKNGLAHSNLADGVNPGWVRLSENVGYGSSVEGVHGQFLQSTSHRNNILDRGMTHVGVGVAQGHGRTFVVHVFSQR